MTKSEIRKMYLAHRMVLSQEEVVSKSKKITEHFFTSVDLTDVRTLHLFLPIVSKNEIDTWLIVDRLRKDFSQIKISVPKVENDRLVNFYFENESQLEKNQWGISEPVSGEQTFTEKIDLVIVPLLAFDKKGNRVGYGKGFYDRFLKECRTGCKKIGLSFFEPIDELIPIDRYDVTLDAVITPTETISFKN